MGTAGGTEPEHHRVPVALDVIERAMDAASTVSTLAEAAAGVLADLCHTYAWPVGHLYLATSAEVLTPTAVWYLADPERYRVLRQVAQAAPVAAGVGLPGQVLATGRPAGGPETGEAAVAAGLVDGAAVPVLCGPEVVAVLHLLGDARSADRESLLATAAAAARALGQVVDRRRAAAAERDRLLLLQTANDAYVRLDGEGRIVEWNHQAEATFGWTRDAALGRSLTELVVPLRYRPVLDEAFRRALAEGDGPVVSRRELAVLHRSGAELPVELTLWGSNDHYRRVVDAFLRDVSERKKFEVQLVRQALHDRLTGLPNRVLLRDRLENALARTLRHLSTVALVILDVDRFKIVNDSLGHEGGDRLLVAVAERLSKLLRPGDTLARMGGDEFALLCEDVTGRAEAVEIAERVVAAMEAHFTVPTADGPTTDVTATDRATADRATTDRVTTDVPTTDVAVTVSVGVAVTTGAGVVADLLLRDADVAMYRAKQRGRGRFEVFDETMRSQAVDRLSVENDLRRAIRQGQLRLVYQPIVHLDTGQIVGFEALVRWQHPERGLLTPADFIPPAEETGLIVPLGRCVLGEACLQAAAWQRRRGDGQPLRMSVNVSAKQLQHPGWAGEVAGTLADTGLEPSHLVLELTESVLMEDADATAARLEELRQLGVRIAIDDFGTGYSSLGYLRRLPVDVLKIDKSFIDGVAQGPHESALARAVVKLARTLGLDAVAEGVADARQLSELRRLRCPYGQGYHFSRPQTVDVIDELLEVGVLPPPDALADSQTDADRQVSV